MTEQAPNLLKHRPFQLAWAFDVLCLVGGIVAFYVTNNVYLIVAAVILGTLPMAVVLARFSKTKATTDTNDRSKDLVQ